MTSRVPALLTINTGSSSLKAALYAFDQPERRELAAQVERVGLPGSRLRLIAADGERPTERATPVPDHGAALLAVLDELRRERPELVPVAVGHRVVHGGPRYREPQLITTELTAALRELVPVDPEHTPQAISAIEAVGHAYPSVPQVACFDTAFHRHMPRIAQIYGLPRRLQEAGVLRYGFHGLSYEYIVQTLQAQDPVAARERIIIAHLGNGASMVGVRDGVGIDTTMGFSPTGGLVMSSRSGDLDPGVLLFLLRERGLDPQALSNLVNRESGLLGVSGSSADMRELLGRAPSDAAAAEAVELFCYQARKFIGALAAVLGGLDTLVFTGGIGEHAAPVRERICAGLGFLSMRLDTSRNAAHAPVISAEGSPVTVRVLATDEDLMIARHTHRLVGQKGADRVLL